LTYKLLAEISFLVENQGRDLETIGIKTTNPRVSPQHGKDLRLENGEKATEGEEGSSEEP
jgi:hypothetical protein